MEDLIGLLIINIVVAAVFWWIHKRYDYLGTRWVLVALTIIFPVFGVIYFIILTIQRLLGKKKAEQISSDIEN